MPAESPPQLDVLLMDVLARRSDERAAYINEACGGDRKLQHELEALLKLHEQAGDFLESPAVALPERRDLADIGERLGSFIGRYKLLEHIGEGGFGSVFMAEQEQPVRRKVALKVIKLGMDTRQVVARFEAERQALAMMDHPNIARVLDGGATESGRPYFVMELVRGTPITAFCDEHRLTVRERLDLFVQVCHAVQHAHTKGVIHRDLKPSNILAVRNDGTPTVKVIDFGIVKAIGVGDRLTDKTLFTEFRQLIGTPAYMSPEQAGMSDIDVDTRSDIYSLGVLLYELLAGATPFDAKSLLESGHDEMRRIIREVEPPKPSTRLSSLLTVTCKGTPNSRTNDSHLGELSRSLGVSTSHSADLPPDPNSSAAATVAAFRRTEPRELARSLRGELDWIAMKCLDKDRSRRYETASGLARDVERHLAGEPVVAAPPSRLYRASKTLRRHRVVTAVTAGFVVLVAGGLVALGAFWRTAARARDAESDQRARAEVINRFLTDMLTAADPAKAKGAKLTVREALDAAAKRIEEQPIKDQPLVEADVRFTIGSTYSALGLHSEAEAQLRAADAIQTRELGNDHRVTLRTRYKLAAVLSWKSDYAGAAMLAKPIIEAQTRVLGADHPETLQSTVLLGRVLWAQPGQFFEAESILRSAVDRLKRVQGPNHRDTANAMDWLGELYAFNTYAEKAEPLHREALRIHTQALGDEHPATLNSMQLLVVALYGQARHEEAETINRRLLELRLRVLGSEHMDTLICRGNLALMMARQGRYAEAETIHRENLAALLRTVGPDHITVITGKRFLADCLTAQGKYAEAELLLREALDVAVKKYGPEEIDTSIRVMCELASLLARQRKDAEAEQVARRVLDIQNRQLPRPEPGAFTQSSIALIRVLKRRGAADEALQVEQRLIEFYLTEAREPDASARIMDGAARRLLEASNKQLRDAPRALKLAILACERSERQNPNFLRTLAKAYLRTGDSFRAKQVWEQAISLLSDDQARAHMLNAAAAEFLTVTPESLRNPAEAMKYALQTNELTNHKNANYLDTLALAYFQTGDTLKAIKLQKEAMLLLPADAHVRAEYEERLAEFERGADRRIEQGFD